MKPKSKGVAVIEFLLLMTLAMVVTVFLLHEILPELIALLRKWTR